MSISTITEAVSRMSVGELLILLRYVKRQIARRCEKDCGDCCHACECPGKKNHEKPTV